MSDKLNEEGIKDNNKNEQVTVKFEDYVIGEVKEYTYVGHLLSAEGQMAEIKRRIQIGQATFRKYKAIMVNKIVPINYKKKILLMCVFPTMLYVCETWAFTKEV